MKLVKIITTALITLTVTSCATLDDFVEDYRIDELVGATAKEYVKQKYGQDYDDDNRYDKTKIKHNIDVLTEDFEAEIWWADNSSKTTEFIKSTRYQLEDNEFSDVLVSVEGEIKDNIIYGVMRVRHFNENCTVEGNIAHIRDESGRYLADFLDDENSLFEVEGYDSQELSFQAPLKSRPQSLVFNPWFNAACTYDE